MPEARNNAAIAVVVLAILVAIASFIAGAELYAHGDAMADRYVAVIGLVSILVLRAVIIWQDRQRRKPE